MGVGGLKPSTLGGGREAPGWTQGPEEVMNRGLLPLGSGDALLSQVPMEGHAVQGLS